MASTPDSRSAARTCSSAGSIIASTVGVKPMCGSSDSGITPTRVIFLYLVALLLVVLSLFVINRLLRMPLGRAWEALREDEIACRSLGLSPRRIKLTAFTISAAFAGFAGTLFAARQGFVSPESFTFAESAFVLAIVVLGGMGSQFAVILAAILLGQNMPQS